MRRFLDIYLFISSVAVIYMLSFKENVLSTTMINKKVIELPIILNTNASLKKEQIQYDIGSCCCCTCCCCIGVNVGSGSVSTNFNQPNAE